MGKIIGLAFLQISAYSSVVGLYLTVYPLSSERPNWHWMLLSMSLFVTIWLIIIDIGIYIKSLPKNFKTQVQIDKYMRNWVNSGGRVVIFSRDLSWAHEEKTKEILIQKAERNELTICVESNLPLAVELEMKGATVIRYGGLHIPRSRFTIVDFEKEGARVAVGERRSGCHVIQEYRNGEHPFFGVAEDLIKFLLALEQANNDRG